VTSTAEVHRRVTGPTGAHLAHRTFTPQPKRRHTTAATYTWQTPPTIAGNWADIPGYGGSTRHLSVV